MLMGNKDFDVQFLEEGEKRLGREFVGNENVDIFQISKFYKCGFGEFGAVSKEDDFLSVG
jgi:hypothetical protein